MSAAYRLYSSSDRWLNSNCPADTGILLCANCYLAADPECEFPRVHSGLPARLLPLQHWPRPTIYGRRSAVIKSLHLWMINSIKLQFKIFLYICQLILTSTRSKTNGWMPPNWHRCKQSQIGWSIEVGFFRIIRSTTRWWCYCTQYCKVK